MSVTVTIKNTSRVSLDELMELLPPGGAAPRELAALRGQEDPTDMTVRAEHAKMVAVLAKGGQAIRDEMTVENHMSLKSACITLANAADLLDKVKKQVVYQKDLGIAPPASVPERVPTLTPHYWHLIHMMVGLAGEAGELLEVAIKLLDGEELDYLNMVEEMGDVEFYAQGIRGSLGMSRESVLKSNQEKLSVRYKEGYSDEAAQLRADKP